MKGGIKMSCKGCYTFIMNNHAVCSTILVSKPDKCPCRICLIKGVCNKPCKEYIQRE